jgi:hypothetical protein
MAETEGDALVIADATGVYYVIPRSVIEAHRIPDAYQEKIDEALDVDTVGFASLGLGYSLVGPLTAAQQRAHELVLPI